MKLTDYYVSYNGGKTFRKQQLTSAQVTKKRNDGQIVNKHPCHLCWYWWTGSNGDECHYSEKGQGRKIQGGVCMGFAPKDADEYGDKI